MADPELVPVEDRAAVLCVAGHDPSAGAGLTTDAAVIRAFGLHPLPVLTGVAIQNTRRLSRRHDLPTDAVLEQLQLLTEEFLLGAVKIGMLGRGETAEMLAGWLDERPRLPAVLDPVLRSSSGGSLAEAGLEQVIVRRLLPRVRVVTPNLEEASMLSGREIRTRDDVPEAARAIRDLGAAWVLIKGGHLPRFRSTDYLLGAEGELWLEEDLLGERSVRGTGCALAAALAAGLARGESVPGAARAAKRFTTQAMDRSYVAGRGRFLEIERFRDAE